jgi:hypothetical protein
LFPVGNAILERAPVSSRERLPAVHWVRYPTLRGSVGGGPESVIYRALTAKQEKPKNPDTD